ncbi:MAG: hypothetical protein LH481_01850 [Burkholderiales bacterium]|nr:hypothetical protein [Burkholderiales bacterium]
MNLSAEQLAELLAGIARSQQAIIDAIESESGGWRNTHLLPKLNTASNMRLATPRLLDIPSRILLRSQGRIAMDVPTIARLLDEAVGGAASAPTQSSPASSPQAAPLAAPVAAAAVVAGVAAVTAIAAAESSPAGADGSDLGNFFDS